jgi:hypothetical protein
MKRLAAIFIALALATAISTGAQSAQSDTPQAPAQASAPPDATAKTASLPKGTRLIGKITTKLDTKHTNSGQAIVVEVTKDVKPGDQILLRSGSLVKGTITQAQQFSKGNSNAEFDIVLDTVVSKTGEQFANHFAIYALSAKGESQPGDMYASGGKQRLASSAGVSGQVNAPRGDVDLTPQSVGIFGIEGVELHPLAKMTPPTAVMSSGSGNFVLYSGTKVVLESIGQ